MDLEAFLTGSSAGIVAAVAFVLIKTLWQALQSCNHHRIRSRCCDRVGVFELDVTPSAHEIRVQEATSHALAIAIPPSPPQPGEHKKHPRATRTAEPPCTSAGY